MNAAKAGAGQSFIPSLLLCQQLSVKGSATLLLFLAASIKVALYSSKNKFLIG